MEKEVESKEPDWAKLNMYQTDPDREQKEEEKNVRCLKKMPNFSCLKEKIYKIHNTEKYIAISKNKVGKHTKKWNSFM